MTKKINITTAFLTFRNKDKKKWQKRRSRCVWHRASSFFVYNLCIFERFSGQKDDKGVANTMRFKLYIRVVLTGITVLLFFNFREPLTQMYLNENPDGGDVTQNGSSLPAFYSSCIKE